MIMGIMINILNTYEYVTQLSTQIMLSLWDLAK